MPIRMEATAVPAWGARDSPSQVLAKYPRLAHITDGDYPLELLRAGMDVLGDDIKDEFARSLLDLGRRNGTFREGEFPKPKWVSALMGRYWLSRRGGPDDFFLSDEWDVLLFPALALVNDGRWLR